MKTSQFLTGFCVSVLLAACSGTATAPTFQAPTEPGVSQPGVGDMVTQPEETPSPTGVDQTPTQLSPDQPVSNDPGEQVQQLTPAVYDPKAGDDLLTRGPAYIDRMDLLMEESNPPLPVLALAGSLPDPCHALRVLVKPPDADGNIIIDVYSVADPDKICTQVLSGFEQSIPLSPLPSGKYTVVVNGKNVGQFEIP